MAGLDVKISQLGEVVVASDNDLLNLVTYDEQNQTYISGKVKASTMKDYMIGDTDISELGDGTPTGAIDALDDKIDDNYDDWKEQWKKNGAYNICPNEGVSTVIQGVTFIVNSDKSVTVSTGAGGATGNAFFLVATGLTLKAGTYKLVGCPSGGSIGTYYLYCNSDFDGTAKYDYGTGNEFTLGTDGTGGIRIFVGTGTVITTPITFKPMITTDLDATYDDYEPHAKTNRELTEGGVQTIYEVSTPAQQAANYSFPLSRSIKNAKKLIISYNYGATGYGYSRVVDVPTYFPTILDTIVENAFSSVEVSTSSDYVKVISNGSVNGVFFRKIDAIY